MTFFRGAIGLVLASQGWRTAAVARTSSTTTPVFGLLLPALLLSHVAPSTTSRAYSVGLHPNRILHNERKLNEEIVDKAHARATTLHDFMVFYDRHNREMSPVNVSSLLGALGHLARRLGQADSAKNERFFDHLARKTFDLMPVMSGTSLADVALSLSFLSITDRDILERLWQELEARFRLTDESRLQRPKPKDLAKVAEALETFVWLKANQPHTRNPLSLPLADKDLQDLPLPLDTLLPALTDAAVAALPTMTPNQLISLATFLPRLASSSSSGSGAGSGTRRSSAEGVEGGIAKIFQHIEVWAVANIRFFTPAQMEDMVWAFASTNRDSKPLTDAIRHQAQLLRIHFDEMK